ncbi:MAG: GAF domain-containing protein [Symploca sp. SIO2G7]|nr:GAF domain-containing protein [Symploca sp. SIO2G7]
MKLAGPNSETARLEALRQYKILDTAPEEVFDELTDLAAKVCQTPIALITLIDDNHHWLKSQVGFTVRETSREISFCSHTILKNELFVIPDTLADERFATNPLVTSEPHLRFYAGAPLITPQGYPLGVICVMDYVPRKLSAIQLEVLQALSRQVITQLKLQQNWIDITKQKEAEEPLQESESRYRAIVEDQTELICRFSPDGKLTFVNHNYCCYFGKSYEELIGEEIYHIIPNEERERVEKHLASLSWEYPVGTIEHYVIIPNGQFRIQQWSDRAIFDEQGKLVEFQSVGRDITAQKQAEEVLRQQSRTLERFSTNLKHLHRINTTDYQDFDTLFNDCLDIGCEIFGLSTGIISQIIDREAEGRRQEAEGKGQEVLTHNYSYIIRSVQSELEFLLPGLEFDLKDTYCAAVVQTKKTITYPHVGKIAAMTAHPVYQNLKLESYIGTPIFVQGKVYGTLNFSSTQVKSSNFEPHEQEIIELMAQSIGRFIAAHQTEMERQRVEDELRRQHRRSQLFAEVTLNIRQSLQLEEILHTTVTEVQKFLQADRVVVFQLGFDGSGTVLKEAVVPPFPVIQGQDIIDPCFEQEYLEQYYQGRVGAIADIEKANVEPCYVNMLQQFSVRANLVVPILQKQELWGLLIAHQCSGPRQWTNFETELLRQIADQIGIALAQAQLLERETRQRQELARSNVELQQFAYIASHDLQEPLRKIQAFGDRLKVKFDDTLTDQGRDYLERMQNAARRMQILIDDLLSLSRVTTKTQPFIPVNLSLVVQNVLSDLEISIQETGAQVEVGDLPTVEADPVQMRQLLQNLIGNALKFHKAEEQPVVKIYSQLLMSLESPVLSSDHQKQVPTDATNNRDSCQILVKDNGIGFEEKYLDRIFNAFQRLHGRSEYPGTGIGLAICRKIVERHGGSITATSVLGQGATFMITLPLKQAQGDSAE